MDSFMLGLIFGERWLDLETEDFTQIGGMLEIYQNFGENGITLFIIGLLDIVTFHAQEMV